MEIPGWSLLIHSLSSLLVWINQMVGGNPGLAIILFTVLVKLATLPLTLKSLQSSRNMQAIQPLIKEVQQKYKDDRQLQQQEVMKVYSAHGVNPALGCLPTLLQFPIFIALYQALIALVSPQVHIDLPALWGPVATSAAAIQAPFAQPFLWIPNLAAHDPLYIMPVLAAAFQFISQRMAIPYGYSKNADPQQQSMNRIMQFMPLMIIIFYSNFAAGAVLYWTASAPFQAVQQYFITGFGALAEIPFLSFLPKKELPKITPKVVARQEEEAARAARRKAATPEPPAADTGKKEQPAPLPNPIVSDNRPAPKGLFARMMEQAIAAQEAQTAARAAADGGTAPAVGIMPERETRSMSDGAATTHLESGPNGAANGSTQLPRKKRSKR